MNSRKQHPARGPRPQPSHGTPGGKPSKHYWHHCWPYRYHDWYDYDYDWYDYDYDYTDWDFYSSPQRTKSPRPPVRNWETTTDDPVVAAYQQGFKDGWSAAMDYMVYGETPPVEPPPVPTPPVKPTEEKPE